MPLTKTCYPIFLVCGPGFCFHWLCDSELLDDRDPLLTQALLSAGPVTVRLKTHTQSAVACFLFWPWGHFSQTLFTNHFVCMEPIYILGLFSCYRDLKTWFVRALRFYMCGEEMWASGKPSGHPSFHQQLPSWLAPLLPVSYLGISSGSEGSIVNTYIPVHHYSQEHFPDSKILVFESC